MTSKEEEEYDEDRLVSPRSSNKRLKTSGDEGMVELDPLDLPLIPPQSTGTKSADVTNDLLSSPPQHGHNDRHPHTFVTWNCNGFTSRTRWNAKELETLLTETNHPDMICLQEVRLKASGPDQRRGKPMDKEYHGTSVELAMQTIFQDYTPFWSLADTKYSGTLTLIHTRRCMQDPQLQLLHDSNNNSSSKGSNHFAAFTPKSAIALILERLHTDRESCGLLPSSETLAVTISASPKKKKKVVTQRSMTSFFAPKNDTTTTTNNNNNNTSSRSTHHNAEGRFQFFFFPDMDVMQTYVPNNGTKDESFQKRQQWDHDMLQFLQERKQILHARGGIIPHRKLLWLGDLNVAHDHVDGTHWKRQPDGTIYEWWRDESKCFVQGGDNKNPTSNKTPENRGIPGFTTGERQRFTTLLQQGDFCDVWRQLHPNGVAPAEGPQERSIWDRANYTWRGHLAREGGRFAKYQGKGQRLDYFLLSPSRLVVAQEGKGSSKIVKSCEILGYGTEKEGLFCGSDHCAVRLELEPSSTLKE